jgi:hypothetical protein
MLRAEDDMFSSIKNSNFLNLSEKFYGFPFFLVQIEKLRSLNVVRGVLRIFLFLIKKIPQGLSWGSIYSPL